MERDREVDADSGAQMRPRGEAARSAAGTGGGQGQRRAGPDGTWAGAAAKDRRLRPPAAASPPNQGRRDALWLARGQTSGMDSKQKVSFGEGVTWVPSSGQGHLGLEITFLFFFFLKKKKKTYLFYTEHVSNLGVILAPAAGDRLVFSGSFHVECIHCRNEPRPRVSEQPRCFVFGRQFPGAGRSPGDLAKSCEFGLIEPEVCRPRRSA